MASEPRGGQGGFSSERQQLLKLLLRDKGVKADPRRAPIARRPDPGTPARLSFAQQRLWILDRLEPGSASYNIPVALRLVGRLDVPALLAAMAEVVRRHEALRTTFAERDGMPVQVVHPPPARGVAIGAVADLAALPALARDRELLRLAREEAARPFDLRRGPLARLTLIHLGEDHALLLTMHHIVSDGWSAGVFVREMTALYQSFTQGLPSSLPELEIQYPDFAEWQRSWLSGDTLAGQLGYWREQLAGAPPALELPTDRPRPVLPDGRGGVRTFAVDRDVAEALNALCRREGATLFMALLAAFSTTLGRHAGQRDLVVGSPIANRNRAEIEGLIGFFVNSLALRVDLTGDPTFGELLARARGVANGAYAHQDLPFERLVEELHPERELGRNPIFQVMFALQNAPPGAVDIPNLTLEPLEAETGAAQFDLMVDLYELPEGLAGRIGYAVELFDAPTVDRLAVHFVNLLTVAAADPGLPLSRISFLSEAERHQLVLEWGTRAEAGQAAGGESVLDLFEAQAARSSGAVAVRSGDDPEAPAWTYGELDRAAGAVAERLRSLGVGPDVRVGLMAARVPEAVAALLGIWKAGGVYVPLDPAWPAARLELLLGDSGVRVLLTQQPFLERLAAVAHGAEVVLLEETSTQDDTRERARLRRGDLAYLIYTSGTTGAPKAVMVEHGSLLHTLRSVQALFGIGPGDALTCLSPFSFDVSLFELLAPLLAGGTLVLMDLRPAPDLVRLAAVLEGVEVFHAVPALMRRVVETIRGVGPERFARLRTVCMGGEAVSPRLLEEIAEALPGARPWVLYGPTEATIFATAQKVGEGDAHRSWPGTWLGRPLSGFTLRVLDADGQPVPAGVAGELYLGGPAVARGYFGREALTAEKFVEIEGGRFYRTGDLARFLSDGGLVYLGRADDQVKVRGFRIELGEVEAALAALPGVRQAAVVTRGEGSDRRLAAFVVAEEDVDPRRLREGLRASLPEYMVPGEIVAIDALPLSPTGKVDRRALAEAAGKLAARDAATRYEAPRTATEQLVAQMWADLLGVGTAGVHDNFFDLGGHSLLATQVVSRVRELFGVELPLRALFEAPTVETIAARVEAARREAQGLQAPPIVPVSRDGDLPLSFAQERLWLFDRMQPGLPVYNVPQATRWRGPLRVEVLGRVLEEIVDRHESLRTRIGLSASGRPVQVIDAKAPVPVPVVDLQALPGEAREAEAGRRAEEETWRPFDLVHGPVLRACVLRLAPDDHVTVFTRHHIAFDGWSNDVFSRELAVLYDAFSQERPSPLPPLPVQYADFAVWQRSWLSGEVLERQLGWWRERLAGAPALLQIPTDRPRPAVQGFQGVIASLRVPVPRVLAVEALCRREGVTPFMALLAAWKLLLSRYGAGTDLVVGSPVANRHRIEVEGLIGFFANTMVLRTDLAGDPTVHDLLARVRETALGAYEHQDTPFEKLIEELRPERSLSHTPLFQVLFAMNELGGDAAPAPEPGPAALSSQMFNGSQAMSRYDLELYVFRGAAFLELALEYRVDLFDRTRIDRMLEHLSNLLDAMAADPGLPVSRLPMLTEEERHQLLVGWNDTGREAAPAVDLFGLVAAQADRTPDAVALVWGEERRTYGGLRSGAGRLADRLRALGVGPEVRVGVCLERTPRLVEALLAVLAAAGAYVPLDPNYPAERLAFMREDSGMKVLVTEEHLAGKLGSRKPIPTVILSEAKDLGGDLAPATPPLPGNLAYVLYTSGSTGQPKAVAVEHRSAAALAAWAAEVFAPEELDGVLASTSIAFDLSVFELFVTLSRGGKVVLAPDALHLPSLPAAGEVTLVNTVPSVLAELLRMAGLPRWVRVVNLAGEPLPGHLVEEVYAQPSVERVLNLYGPSEDTTYSTWSEVPRGEERSPSIGRPVAGTRVYLLDLQSGPEMQPVPAGVSGEICLAGAGLARGYLGRPELTAERFVPDPFGAPGERLYRTGDLARYRADGEIEFLGRRDHQVKVRGFRIELGEVEAALRRHPGVRDVAVVVHDAGGDRRLVACWVPRGEGREPADGELRSFLQKRLPGAMLPSAFLALPALPLTPNGKVDRQALSRLDPTPFRPRSARDEEPLSPTEERVAGIWREVLDLPEVGPEESFFSLGGHSLLATRVTSRLREVFGVELPVRTLFEAPTVRELARVVERATGAVEEETGAVEPAPPAVDMPRMPFLLLDRQLRPVPAGVPGEVWLGGVHPGTGGSDRFAPDPATPGAWLYRTDEIARLLADGTLEILTQRIETAGEAEIVPRAVPVPRDGSPLPLSFAQERLWFLDRLEPGGSIYNMPFALAARGALEPARLDAVLSEVVRRHEALRTTFEEQEGRPVQVIAPPPPVRLPLVDLSALPGAQAEAERLAAEEARRPFDLRRGPLLRGALLRLSSREEGDEHVLLLDMHHIVTDGWSLGVLVGEVSALYRASLAGEPSPLPELPIQYADFAVWQREQLGEKGMERQLAFWRERLAGAPAVLDLPADRPRPVVQSFRGGRFALLLGPGPLQGLRRLGGRYGATLFMTLLGGGAALLQRLTGQDDLVIGTPIANRNHLATERLIGFFVNSLALRLDLADDPAAGALLERCRDAAFAAYDHQDLPFERLVEELRPERHLSHHPVFQVMLALQNAPGGAVDLPGLTLETFGFETLNAKFDLELTFEEVEGLGGEGALVVTIGYSADLFDASTAQRLVGQLVTLLEGLAAAELERRISGLPLLTEPERHQLALEWNDSPRREAPAETLHGLVEAQAELRPDAVALADDGAFLTYGELVRRAGRLAAALGVEPEERVGLRLPNTFERVIVLLAVLRAGGAYVPLDPTYPTERLAFLVRDSGAKVVLDELPPLPETPFTPPAVLPEQAAYVTYTSGSTGVPNGVVTTHRGAVSFVVQASRLEGLEPGVRLPQIASFGFDASVLEIFLALANGGVLVRVPEEERLAPEGLADRLVRQEATALSITPALLATLPEPRLRGVRHLYVGGDACLADLPPRWAAGRRFYNCYGPTETTVFALTGLYEDETGVPPIGRPLGGARAYAVDREMRQVPIGIPGEMALGGPSLSRGYLDRPALTAERFVPDPFGEPGSRLYRTGDLVRQLPDGRFEFLGRLDGQVKLRGLRIETGEVEAALASHPEVREAVVIARDDPSGKRLVAYVVREEGGAGEGAATEAIAAEHVESWRTLYDETYASGSEFTGWNSSYTGLPIPEEEMREWADTTADRILALRPRRVLEIGCGTGILLRRVAPPVERYHGTDFSRVALDRLRPEAGRLGATLEERAADDWSGIEPGSFDLVVLNSVSQYFPGAEYLVRVLRGAARAVAPGGAIFVGDVRSLPLLEDFALSVEQAVAPSGISDDDLWRRVRRRVADEEELVVDPGLFDALAEATPAIGGVEVLGKSGRFDNEMTRFRYDVVLRVGGGEDGEPEARPWSAWANDPLRARLARRLVPRLRQFLRERLPEYMVPSAFVMLDALPITTHGKVDRAALPAPDSARAEGAYQAPRDPVEAELAEAWAELLGAERVGVLDNFFDLGGHSLLATQVISRVRDRLGVELPVRALFEEPTVAGLAVRVREERSAAASADTAPIEPIAPIAPIPRDGSPLPLSFAQERLWFLDRLEPGSPAYNLPVARRLTGSLDVPALARALLETVRRHEALRTTFVEVDGRPAQAIAPAPEAYALPVVDLSALEREDEPLRLLHEESMRPFDLERGPLLRPLLLRLAPDDHVVLLAMHHIVGDGWSLDLLVGEMTALYAAFQAGRPSPLPPLRIQYADYAVWQRRRLRPEVLEEQAAFWREALAGAPSLELPTDRPRPPVQTWRGDAVPFGLAPEVIEPLTALARSQGATRFMALLAVWAAVLGRWAGQEDVSVGTPVASRDRAEIEPLIGFFANTLVLRVDLAGAPGLRELLGRTRRVALAAFAHQDLPFARVVEAVQPERDLSRSPLFQAMFGLYTSRPAGGTSLPGGLAMGQVGTLASTAKFDVSLFLAGDGHGLSGSIEHSIDLFDRATVEGLAERFQLFLEAALREPERPVSDLPFLTPAEHGQLAGWNDTADDLRGFPDLPVHRLIEEQAARTPDAVAATFEAEALTYAAINARANRLARHLISLGAGPEVRVAVSLERSLDLPVALLAVLKAGAVFLPLDTGHPPARRKQVVEDAGAALLVTRSPWPAALPEGDLAAAADPANLAYVLYTSGSTGRPKGVQVPHRALSNLIASLRRWTGFGPNDVLLAVTTPAFDIALVELLLPLTVGGRIAVAPRESVTDGARLAALLLEAGATVMQATPVTWRLLLEGGWEGKERALLMTGGETLSRDLADRLLVRSRGGNGLWNLYGPTETAVYATGHRVVRDEEPVPIGVPLPNTQGWVLDRRLQPVPPGAVGELYVGGLGLARGYLGQPDRTAESFLPDPFSGEPGARLYRTGDLARQRVDGAIELLGRVDHQVKLRGIRVEIGEVEAALASHPEVREAVVTARDEPAGKRLVAYVVRQGEGAGPDGLRRFLRERLPEYMVPSAFVPLDALPVTPHGKVDRAALPAPDSVRAGGEYHAPRDPVEADLAEVWAELLGAGPVGVLDNFFDLGGHSLLATRVISRVRDRFGVDLPVRVLFEEPTVAGLASHVRQAAGRPPSPAADAGTPTPPLEPVPRDGSLLPLSFAQERLWFLDRLVPGIAVYNMPLSLRLPGHLPLPALAASLSEVVRRHEALRTRFVVFSDEPIQVIDEPSEVLLPVVDLSGLPERAREDEARRQVAEEAARRFDLEAEPMLRAGLLRLAPDDHVLLLTLHHIAADGWSLGVLAREIETLLPAFAAGRPSPLPPLPVQYADYAVWQRRWLSGAELERQIGYWRERLAGAPAVLSLPLDRPRPPVRSFRGASRGMALPLPLLNDLAALAGHSKVSLFMLLLAVWKTLLARITGESDLVVGTPIANRHRQEVEGLIGFFANMLVLRTDLDGDPSFLEILERVRETALSAYAHQDLPFERLVEELAPERSLGYNPLFQVQFTLDETSPLASSGADAGAEPGGAANQIARFDLTLAVQRGPYGGDASIGYNTDLFRGDTAERLLGYLQRLLEGVVAEPARRLSELPLLSEAERHQLLRDWNDTARDLGAGALLHELFERWAAETPEAAAIVFDDATVTYGELDRRASRLATRLAEIGVRPDDTVGVLLPRSVELFAAFLAVLKAGGAWVPLDPSHPEERRALVLRDSGARVLISSDGPSVVVGEGLVPFREGASPSPTAEALAYVIYTSGSTGKPQGVMVPHRAVVDRLREAREMFAVRPESRLAQVLSPGFDASVMECFLALAHGASLCLVPDEERLTPHALAATLERQGATVAVLTPAVLSLWPEERLTGLRALSVGGEPFPAELAARWARGRRVLNVYGPTEATIFASSQRARPDESEAPSIGRPAANTRIHLLDRALRPVPLGVAGEIAIGGVGLARGYLGRPDRTAERFIPNPWSETPGERLYRSGDLARLLPDGRIEFLGRIDQQVKMRGYRIEPGEIEAALRLHPSVRDAAVLVRGGRTGDPELVGYVVLAEGTDAAVLRPFLEERLPVYMVPSAFVTLDALPVTPNGKVDRAALPAPGAARAGGEYQAPRDPVEAELAEVWAELLGAGRVGVLDNFFDLGGHSLLATQVVSRVRDRFGAELTVSVLFEEPTIAGFANRVRQAAERPPSPATDAGTPTPPLEPVPRDGSPLPLSFAQERLWFLDRLVPGLAVYNMPLSLRLPGPLPLPVLAAGLSEVVRRHEALRTRFAVAADRPVQVIDPPSEVRLPVVDLSGLPEGPREEEARRQVAEEAVRRFDLEAGPMLRAGLLRLAPEDHVLLLTLHHIASDGWSMGVLEREIDMLLPAFAAGRPSPLPPLPVQYADYAVWQRRWLSGAELERQVGYWRERLAGAPAVLSLPLDRPRPPVRSFRGAHRGMALPETLLNDLAALARHSGASLFMTLLAVWKTLLARVTGESDLVVGSPIANRHRQEVEGLIGFFVNTLVLRTDLDGDPSFLEIVARVRETALGAYAHQDLPFERLVEELAPERSLRHNPLFQVLFTLDETSPMASSGPGAGAEPVGAANQIARFDLTLAVQRGPYGGVASIGYNTDLFRDDTAERLLGYFQRLLEGVVAEPARRLSELPLFSEPERHQLLRDWNDTARDLGADALLHELFEEWAAATPDAAAIVFDDATVTYGELDRCAGLLAARLVEMGVGPDDTVGVLLPRSVELFTAILAVLKAGGAWVPLDPSHPEERRDLMLRDSGARVLVTEEMLVLADGPAAPVALRSPERLAYVIYTSGSTGTPNGVMVPHRAVVDRLREAREMFAVGPESRLAQVLSPGFDASVMEAFLALAHGASLCLVPDEERLTPHALAATLERQGATVAVLTPAVLSLWPEERLTGLRALSVGGEPFPAELAALWSRGRRVLNVYGPTEATIFASYQRAFPDDEEAPPIGRPAANTRIHLLDRALRPVPLGVAGEIAIGGVGVARGYLGRPDRTAERFIPDPWSETPGARLYRSGDLARLLPDGRIEFLGRIDQQVKVRGYRIEPGEIEAALRLHPSVRDAAVLVREGRTGDPELVGYVVLAEGADIAALRPFLEEWLPVYMVPALVPLPALPVTPNGKLDRRALSRMPLTGESQVGRGRTEPDGPVERFVTDLFKEVLRLDVVGLEESFFDLGGTSLQAALLINLLQERLGEYVYVVALFDAPSAAELALYLEREYPAATARLRGETTVSLEEEAGPVTPEMVEELRRIVPPLPPGMSPGGGPRNRRAVFILSPPRSGSTLLRVLLAGHPGLFAPPELELLGFNTLGERRDAFSGRYAFWREGAVRAWMEVRGIPAEEAFREIEEREERDLAVRAFYREMQGLVGNRLLIDKTPSYALDPATLARAEEDFEEPLYIHLLRHPYGMIASFEKAHLEQVFFRHPHPFSSRRLAELIWTVSHQNIQAHLERVPPGRRHFVRFEELVRDPRGTLERLCAFLGVSFDSAMLDPYDDKRRKMTDGVHELSRMMGDVRFHEHQRIDHRTAESWRAMYEEDFLGEPTREVAVSLGYEVEPPEPEPVSAPKPSVLVPLRPGEGPPLFLVHPVGGNVLCYGELARRLKKVPAYGLQAAGLEEGREPHETVEEMADCYLEAVRRAAPRGPYRLMGWSFGGLVAYEMARRLSETGERVEKLVLLDTPVPGALQLPEPTDADLLAGLAFDLGGLAGVDLGLRPADLRGLDAETGLARVLERARDVGALPPGVEAGAFRLWRVYRANARAARAYRPQPYDGRLVVLAAEANPHLGRLGLALGWQRFATGVAAKTLPADHYGLLRPPVVRQIAEKLSAPVVGR